jgi:hypothetical protein
MNLKRAFEPQMTQINAEISMRCSSSLPHLLGSLAKTDKALFYIVLICAYLRHLRFIG